jgi:hypothetical protein
VGTFEVDWPSGMDGAVEVDDKVVANVFPSVLEVPFPYVVYGVVAAFGGGGAMDDDGVDMAHVFRQIDCGLFVDLHGV